MANDPRKPKPAASAPAESSAVSPPVTPRFASNKVGARSARQRAVTRTAPSEKDYEDDSDDPVKVAEVAALSAAAAEHARIKAQLGLNGYGQVVASRYFTLQHAILISLGYQPTDSAFKALNNVPADKKNYAKRYNVSSRALVEAPQGSTKGLEIDHLLFRAHPVAATLAKPASPADCYVDIFVFHKFAVTNGWDFCQPVTAAIERSITSNKTRESETRVVSRPEQSGGPSNTQNVEKPGTKLQHAQRLALMMVVHYFGQYGKQKPPIDDKAKILKLVNRIVDLPRIPSEYTTPSGYTKATVRKCLLEAINENGSFVEKILLPSGVAQALLKPESES